MDGKIVWLVTSILVNLPESNGRPMSFSEMLKGLHHFSYYGKPLKCGFKDLGHKYIRGCMKEIYVDDIFNTEWTNGVITGEKLLKRISSTCMNYESYRKCANCTTKRDCPDETEALAEFLLGKWSVFCDGDQVADWLKTILDSGMSYNTSCHHHDAIYKCIDLSNADNEDRYNFTAFALKSLSEGLSDERRFVSMLCRCLVGEFLYLSKSDLLCGSSWQDVILTEWLKMSATPYLGFGISVEEMKMLQNMRC